VLVACWVINLYDQEAKIWQLILLLFTPQYSEAALHHNILPAHEKVYED
jgi:hypothetical protein